MFFFFPDATRKNYSTITEPHFRSFLGKWLRRSCDRKQWFPIFLNAFDRLLTGFLLRFVNPLLMTRLPRFVSSFLSCIFVIKLMYPMTNFDYQSTYLPYQGRTPYVQIFKNCFPCIYLPLLYHKRLYFMLFISDGILHNIKYSIWYKKYEI